MFRIVLKYIAICTIIYYIRKMIFIAELKKDFPPSLFNELQLAISFITEGWYSWSKSEDCLLEREEIRIIDLYLKTGSYTICALDNKISDLNAYFKIKSGIDKIKLYPSFKNKKPPPFQMRASFFLNLISKI